MKRRLTVRYISKLSQRKKKKCFWSSWQIRLLYLFLTQITITSCFYRICWMSQQLDINLLIVRSISFQIDQFKCVFFGSVQCHSFFLSSYRPIFDFFSSIYALFMITVVSGCRYMCVPVSVYSRNTIID